MNDDNGLIPEITVPNGDNRRLLVTALMHHLNWIANAALVSGDVLLILEDGARTIRLIDSLVTEDVTPSDAEITESLRRFGEAFKRDIGEN